MGRFLATLAVIAAVCATPLRSATIVAEFSLQGSLDDNRGGPSFGTLGGQIQSTGYIFAANQGLTLLNSLLDPASYSIELSFSFDQVSGYRKIIDFKDRASDGGFYDLSGSLNFYPVTTASVTDFAPGVPVHVVLTRDAASQTVVGYVNGQQRFSFNDSGGGAVFTSNAKIVLFADDFATSQGESSAGFVNYVRFYNGALTPSEVSASYLAGPPAAIPEPSTVALLSAGLLVAFWSARKRGFSPRTQMPRWNSFPSGASSHK